MTSPKNHNGFMLELLTDELSELELVTIKMLAKDISPKEIAKMTGVSSDTVYNRLQEARRKVGVHTDPGLVARCLCAGIIE